MGPPELKPDFPDIEWTAVPDSHRYVTRHLQDCNWLQALEGGFDVSQSKLPSSRYGGATDSMAGSIF